MTSHRSIRARITLLATLVVAVVLVASAVVVVQVQEAQLMANLDRTLEQRADQIEAQLVTPLGAEPGAAMVNTDAEDRFAQVLDGEGRVLVATDNVAGADALAELPTDDQRVVTRTGVPVEDDSFRVLIRRLRSTSVGRFVVVGENVDDLAENQWALTLTFAVVIPVVVAIIGAVVWWLVGRTLRPVEAIRSEVDQIGLDQLDRRVAVPTSDDEVARLASTMNDMLARLQQSSELQRQFVADASHELRTPLTRMRSQLEVELGLGDRDLEAVARLVLGAVVDMQQLVDDLLFLARSDAGAIVPPTERVDLDVVVDASVSRQRELSPTVTVDMSRVSAAVVRGDDGQLARLVGNLIANAAHHAQRRVDISLVDSPDGAVLTIDDDGSGIAELDRERIFDRFVRLDAARSGQHGGAGLGLAIARGVAGRHGATLMVAESPTGGARFTVSFSAV